MKDNIRYLIVTSVTVLLIVLIEYYLYIPRINVNNEIIVEHKVINTYKESYQSIYGTYYKYFVVTEDGTFTVSDSEYYDIINTGVYKQWKTSN